jgi:hypothetical protein
VGSVGLLGGLISSVESSKLRELRLRRLQLARCAPVAQLDRATGYEPVGRAFESLRAHHRIFCCSKSEKPQLRHGQGDRKGYLIPFLKRIVAVCLDLPGS